MIRQNIDGMVQPAKVELSRIGFQPTPGKLGQSYSVETCLLHQLGVEGPALLGPMLRIVVSTKTERRMKHDCFLTVDFVSGFIDADRQTHYYTIERIQRM